MALRHGDARLLVASAARPADLSHATIYRTAARLASRLHNLGIRPGDVVAVQLPAWAETVIAHAAIARLGAVILPLVMNFGAGELRFILNQSHAKAIITAGEWRGTDRSSAAAEILGETRLDHHIIVGDSDAEPAIFWSDLLAGEQVSLDPQPVTPDDLAMIVYTSGTTAAPKGVRHSHRTLTAELFSNLDPERRPNLSPWPPGHVAGCLGLMRFWACGVPTILMDHWDAHAAAQLIETHNIYATSGTPLHLGSLLDAAAEDERDLSSLASYLAGATTIPAALIERCRRAGLATFRAYGLSEHPTISQGAPDDPLALRLGSDGRLCPGVEVRIVDDAGRNLPRGEKGEIWSRGPDLFLGYVDPALDEEAFAEGGWFKTGDIGRLDPDNNLTITDRKKDVIIRGGETLSSREIEELLAAMPGVREAAVVGLPDERMGERICAVVRLAPGFSPDIAAVDAHFRECGVARTKTPEHIVALEDFPRTASGKVQKAVLRTMIAGPARDGRIGD